MADPQQQQTAKKSLRYVLFIHTIQRLTRVCKFPAFSVSDCGFLFGQRGTKMIRRKTVCTVFQGKLPRRTVVIVCNEILPEHFIHIHSGQPEAVRVAVIIAGALTVALDERRRAELLQTGTGRGKSLTWALSTCTGVLLHRARYSKECEAKTNKHAQDL